MICVFDMYGKNLTKKITAKVMLFFWENEETTKETLKQKDR